MKIVCATLSFEIQNVLQVLDFFLKLDDQSVVGSTDLISADFRHDLLCSISKLQRANRLLRMVHNWANSRNKRRTCVASKTIL